MQKINLFLNKWWFACLIAAQPVLDVLAFFTQNAVVTPAGIIRLVIMFALPLYLLITLKDKKRIILPMAVIALYCLAHILNCMRVGYISMVNDIRYMLSVVQMPVLAVCFIIFIRDEDMKRQAEYGALAAAALYAVFQLLSVVTGTYTPTYLLSGLGVGGWIISSNRCANSIILTSLCSVGMCFAVSTGKKIFRYSIPALVAVMLIANGTMSCYLTVFLLLGAFIVYLALEPAVKKTKPRWQLAAYLCVLLGAAALIYPVSPMARDESIKTAEADKNQVRLDGEIAMAGYDTSGMSIEEMMSIEPVRDKMQKIYRISLNYDAPQLLVDFGYERVMEKYGYTTDVNILTDVRLMKRTYAQLTFEDCDLPTRLVGFEIARMGTGETTLDLENDWHALFYYYGYIGFALYAAFVLYFVFLILRALVKDFRGSYTPLNYTLMLSLVLQLGLAQFSGALLRRPNVSVYTSLVLALIYYQTCVYPRTKAGERT